MSLTLSSKPRWESEMDDVITRFVHDLISRGSGPLTTRLLLQPLMSRIFAARDGLKDALAQASLFLVTANGPGTS